MRPVNRFSFDATLVVIAVVISALLAACGGETYNRTPSGLLFRIISSPGKDSIVRLGNTVKLHYYQRAGDTILEDTRDRMPIYWMMMPDFSNDYNALQVFNYGLKEGDSVEVIQRVDSMLRKHLIDSLPPFASINDEWVTTIKVLKVFRNDSGLLEDKRREQQHVDSIQRPLGDQRVREYLRGHQIAALRLDSGAYLQILVPGNGDSIVRGRKLGIKYKFSNLRTGKVLDTNTDPAFHRRDTLEFTAGTRFLLPAIDDALARLRPGAHARIYLPTMSAFGGRPPRGNIRPYDDMVFEVWVVNTR